MSYTLRMVAAVLLCLVIGQAIGPLVQDLATWQKAAMCVPLYFIGVYIVRIAQNAE